MAQLLKSGDVILFHLPPNITRDEEASNAAGYCTEIDAQAKALLLLLAIVSCCEGEHPIAYIACFLDSSFQCDYHSCLSRLRADILYISPWMLAICEHISHINQLDVQSS